MTNPKLVGFMSGELREDTFNPDTFVGGYKSFQDVLTITGSRVVRIGIQIEDGWGPKGTFLYSDVVVTDNHVYDDGTPYRMAFIPIPIDPGHLKPPYGNNGDWEHERPNEYVTALTAAALPTIARLVAWTLDEPTGNGAQTMRISGNNNPRVPEGFTLPVELNMPATEDQP